MSSHVDLVIFFFSSCLWCRDPHLLYRTVLTFLSSEALTHPRGFELASLKEATMIIV
jgi:hypothetical protein